VLQTPKGRRSFSALRLCASLGLFGFVAMSGASRASPPDIVAEMRACATEQDDTRRLACYDRTLGRTPNEPLNTAAPQAQAQPIAAGPPAVALAEQQFGMNPQLARKQGGPKAGSSLKQIHSPVKAISRKLHGEPVVTLENGQVWEAAQGEVGDVLKVGDVATIWAGAMGAYYLSVGNRSTRVTRVR
jgi:hypothetical protein